MPIAKNNERVLLILPRTLVQDIKAQQQRDGDKTSVGRYLRTQLPGWLVDARQRQSEDTFATSFARLGEIVGNQIKRMDAVAAQIDALRDELQVRRAYGDGGQ